MDLDDPELHRFLDAVHVWPFELGVVRAMRRLDFRGDPADEIMAPSVAVAPKWCLTAWPRNGGR